VLRDALDETDTDLDTTIEAESETDRRGDLLTDELRDKLPDADEDFEFLKLPVSEREVTKVMRGALVNVVAAEGRDEGDVDGEPDDVLDTNGEVVDVEEIVAFRGVPVCWAENVPVTGDVADTETEPLFELVAMMESEYEELGVAEPDASRVRDTDAQPVDDSVTPPADLVGAAREGDGLIVFVMAIVFVPVPRPLRDDDAVPVRRVDFDSVGVGLNVILTTEPVTEALPPVGESVDCDVTFDETVEFKVIRTWPDGDPVGMTDSVPELRGDDEELGVTLIDAVCDALPELDGVADEVGVSCGVAEEEGETNPDAVIEGETLLELEPLEVLLPEREPDADAEPLTVLEMTVVCVSVFVVMYVDTALSEREGEPDSLMVFVAVRDLDVVDVTESVTEPTTVAVRALSDCVAVTVCVLSEDVVGLSVRVL
jgi:hypothetical protein